MHGKTQRLLSGSGIVLLALAASGPAQADFSYSLAQPALVVTIPGTPAIPMGPHPLAGPERPFLRGYGTDGDVAVSVMTPTAEAGLKATQCADRFGLDLPDSLVQPVRITRLSLDDATVLVYYIGLADKRLHAHLLSSAPGHCVEVHVSRGPGPREQLMDWIKGMHYSRIRAAPPAEPGTPL